MNSTMKLLSSQLSTILSWRYHDYPMCKYLEGHSACYSQFATYFDVRKFYEGFVYGKYKFMTRNLYACVRKKNASYMRFVRHYVTLVKKSCKQCSTQSDNMVKSFRAKGRQLCSSWSSSLITGLQHFHFPSQKINDVLMFQERHCAVVDNPTT